MGPVISHIAARALCVQVVLGSFCQRCDMLSDIGMSPRAIVPRWDNWGFIGEETNVVEEEFSEVRQKMFQKILQLSEPLAAP